MLEQWRNSPVWQHFCCQKKNSGNSTPSPRRNPQTQPSLIMTDNENKDKQPEINNIGRDAETFDNVPEATDETLTDGDAVEAEVVSEMTTIENLTTKLNETEAALAKEKKEYLFLMAEFDNFRKRTIREKADIIRNASENVIKGLLPIVDDFERGLEATRNSDDSGAVRQGMELIYNKLVKFLQQNGVTAMDSTGQPFDSDRHEALTAVPVTDESQKGKVIDTITKGYMINDKVLRHAKVAVGQ